MSDATKFKKIVEKYNSKFQCSFGKFKEFVLTRVELSLPERKELFEHIQGILENDNFGQKQLKYFLHLIAALQAGCNLNDLTSEEIQVYEKIKFLSSKKRGASSIVEEEVEETGRKSIEEATEKKSQIAKKELENNKKDVKNYEKAHIYSKVEIMDEDQEDNEPYKKKPSEKQNIDIVPQQPQLSKINTSKIITKQKLNTIEEQKTEEIYMKSSPAERQQVPQKGNNKINKFEKQQFQREIYEQNLQLQEKKGFQEGDQLKKMKADRKSHQIAEDNIIDNQQISIAKFEKTGQDFMNPIIKYQIIFKNQFTTWRRYSEIQRLMTFLRRKYQGVVLPELPPKQGIKGGLNYLWGSSIDQTFLCQRKYQLETMLNRLLQKNYVNLDPNLLKFLSDENYELPNSSNDDNYWQTFSGLKDIVLNYSELKDYGMAYYSFLSEYKNKPLNTELAKEYDELQEIINAVMITNEHRKKINENFDRRRQIMYNYDVKVRQPCKTELDKILQIAEIDCRELSTEYGKYLQLKSSQSWLNQLKRQKNAQEGTKSLQKIHNQLQTTVKRIRNIEKNLSESMKQFKIRMQAILQNMGGNLIDWRRKVHP